MAIATTPLPLFVPSMITASGSATAVIDASGEKVAMVGFAGKTGTISKLGFRLASITTAETLKISLQGIDANGNPDGTIKAGGNAYATQASPAANIDYTLTLTGAATVTLNDPLAIVLEFDSAVGNVAVQLYNRGGNYHGGQVYLDQYTTSWTKTGTNVPNFWAEYSDGSYCVPLLMPRLGLQAYNSSNEWGNYFQLPWPVRVAGVWAYTDLDNTAYGRLYGPSTGEVTFSTSQRVAVTPYLAWGLFAGGPVDLAANTWYRVAMLPDSSTNIGVVRLYLPSAAAMDGLPLGQNCHLTTRAGAGSWSETTTERMAVGLVVSGFDNGAGGGGSRAVIL